MRFARSRRKLACAAAFALALGAALTAADAQDWPQFRGNPQLTGVTEAALSVPLKLLWTYQAGDAIESSAAIAGGAVYVGVFSGELISLDLATGKLRWRYKIDSEIGESSPAVGAGMVYIGDLSGNLHAVGASDGKPRWVYKTRGEIKASPVVVDGKVLVGSYDGSLYALDAQTGRVAWSYESEGPVHATAGIAGGLAFISGCDGHLRAIRTADGKQEFAVQVGAYTGASPVMDSNHAYFGTFDNQVLAVDLRRRTVSWVYERPRRKFPFYSSAALSGGRLVLGGRDSLVHALDSKTGKALWTFAARARVDSSPAVSGGRAFFGSNNGRVFALDLETGRQVWEFDAGAAITASPAIGGQRLVVSSHDGMVYCFGH